MWFQVTKNCYVEECADSDRCDLNTDLQPTSTSIKMECPTEVHATRNRGYINGSVRGLTCDE